MHASARWRPLAPSSPASSVNPPSTHLHRRAVADEVLRDQPPDCLLCRAALLRVPAVEAQWQCGGLRRRRYESERLGTAAGAFLTSSRNGRCRFLQSRRGACYTERRTPSLRAPSAHRLCSGASWRHRKSMCETWMLPSPNTRGTWAFTCATTTLATCSAERVMSTLGPRLRQGTGERSRGRGGAERESCKT
jgi:hypothetical protein